jgi:phenylalanyl-tRNA synthetase alpha chain
MKDIKKLLDSLNSSIKLSSTIKDLEEIKVEYFGKKSTLTEMMKSISELPIDEKKSVANDLNNLKNNMLDIFNTKYSELNLKNAMESMKNDKVDISLEGRSKKLGSVHPINKIILDLKNCFENLGYRCVEGPEIESVFRNFDALNVPYDHPSRNLSDTFYISDDRLLRTQTTTVQIRSLENEKLPMALISYGKVYRPDYDATHTPMFHQFEGIFLVEDSSFSNMKAVLKEVVTSLFPGVKTRFRPHFFPFTEPSGELDMSCPSCINGCSICKGSGWIEMLGCGMISPEVLKHFGYDNGKIRGFAFGMGIERLAMIRYGIKDIRRFFENDIRFLNQF